MKIAHVTATFPPRDTGIGNAAYHNAVELARRGHEVHVFTTRPHGMPEEETMAGVSVHRLWSLLPYGKVQLLPSLFGRLRDFDFIHLHMPFYGGAEVVYLLHRLRQVPLVITYHQDVQLPGLAGRVTRGYDHTLCAALLCAADRVCFTSLDYACASRYAPLLEQGHVRAVALPNGVDPAHFKPGPKSDELLQRYHLYGQKVILFVGALDSAHYSNGVDVLIRALAQLGRPDVSLLLVGRGNMRHNYYREAERLGIQSQVHLPGFISGAALPDYYRLADVTVLPSTAVGEAFAPALLESLASGIPVLASALPGVCAAVRPYWDGFLVQPGSANDLAQKLVETLEMSPVQRHLMGRDGRRKVKQYYTWSHIGGRLEAMYLHVLAERGRAAAVVRKAEAGV